MFVKWHITRESYQYKHSYLEDATYTAYEALLHILEPF